MEINFFPFFLLLFSFFPSIIWFKEIDFTVSVAATQRERKRDSKRKKSSDPPDSLISEAIDSQSGRSGYEFQLDGNPIGLSSFSLLLQRIVDRRIGRLHGKIFPFPFRKKKSNVRGSIIVKPSSEKTGISLIFILPFILFFFFFL